MTTQILVHHSRDFVADDGRPVMRISSARPYDTALVTIFPHFAYLSFEDAEVACNVLSKGLHDGYLSGYGSFASTMDFNTDGKVVWMSDSSLTTLERNLPDGYELVESHPEERFIEPKHVTGG
jgi:hypothetical protein